jgi:hypothetical protein
MVQPETVYVTSPPPNTEATSDAPISNNLTPPPDAASGGGLALAPSPGTPGSITPSNPQPARPAKESFVSGLRRGAGGEQYVVDGQGNLQSARTAAPSGAGTFGSILGGIVAGALAGASKARMSGVPSADVSGGAGGGVGAAVDAAQQRDLRNRGQAQTQFQNQAQAQRMSREQAESAAVIGHLAAQTASELSATQRANDEHPLNMALKKAGLDEAAVNIQKGHQELITNSLAMMQTLVDSGIEPTAIPTSWNDARSHVNDIVAGKSLPIYNGQEGEDASAGIFNVTQLRNTPIMKDVTFTTYPTTDKDGNAVPKINTLPAGTSAMRYVEAAMEGKRQLKEILSAQSVKQAAELHRATIREKNNQAFKAGAEGEKAQQDAAFTKSMLSGGAGGAPVKLDPNTHADEDYMKSLPASRAAMLREVGEGRAYSARMFSGKDGEMLLQQLSRAYGGQWDQSRAESYFKMRQDFTSGKTSVGLNSYNTAISHLGTMWDHVSNTNSIQLNNPMSDVHRQLNNDLQLVSTELTKAVSNGQMTEGEKKDILGALKSYTVHGYQTNIKEAAQLLHGKQESYQEQWNNGAPPGAVSQVPIISKKAEDTLARINGQQQPQQQQQPNPVTGTAPSPAAGPSNDPFAQFGGRARQ